MTRRAMAAALLALLAACGRGGDGRASSTIQTRTIDLPPGLETPVVALRDALIARSGDGIATSRDGGETWRHPTLPNETGETTFGYPPPLIALGDLAVVSGHDVATGSAVWTSDDGDTWRGGPLIPRTTQAALIGRAGAIVAAAAVDLDARLHVSLSYDRGRTWEAAALPDDVAGSVQLVDVHPEGDELVITAVHVDEHNDPVSSERLRTTDGASWTTDRCARTSCVVRRVGDVLLQGDSVSVDEGRSWEPFALDVAQPSGADRPSVQGAVRTDGGTWIGAASSYVPSDVSYGYLVTRIGHGRWHSLVHDDPCDDVETTRPNSSYGLPKLVGSTWITTRTCFALNEAAHADIVAGVPSDPTWQPLSQTFARRVAYGPPVEIGDVVVVPVIDREERLVRLLELKSRR